MSMLVLVSIQLLLFLIGYGVTVLVGVKNKIEAVGLSYLFGSGLVTLLFLLNHFVFGIGLNQLNFLLSVGVSVSVLSLTIFLTHRVPDLQFAHLGQLRKYFKHLHCFEGLIWTLLALLVLHTFFDNYVMPVTDWDALALYDFRARVMAVQGTMQEGMELGYFFQYPPYTSFLHLFGYIFDADRVKIVYSFIYLSFLLTFFGLLQRTQKNWVAALGTLLLAVDPFILRHATMAYTNLAYVVFLALGLLYISFWLIESKKQDLLVGGILVALSTWVRASDPFWMIGVMMIIIGLVRHRTQVAWGIGVVLSILAIYQYWEFFLNSSGFAILSTGVSRESRYLDAIFNGQTTLSRLTNNLGEIVVYYWQNVSAIVWYLIPPVAFTLYYDSKQRNAMNIVLYLAVGAALALIFGGIVVFSLFYDTWNQIADSLQRLSMILIPLLIFVVFNSSLWMKHESK